MTILDGSEQDPNLTKLWALITELSEQLNHNRDISASIYQQAGGIKTQAVHSQTGFVLRRFNLDKPKEVYDAELERANATMAMENVALQHDNKQLNALIREYEQTLETLMNTFRNRAKDVQERELALAREYESLLLARQEDCDSQDLTASTLVYQSLTRIARTLRHLLRAEGGEPEPDSDSEAGVEEDRELSSREPWMAPAVTGADYAMEREIELVRLEVENMELRGLLGIAPPAGPREDMGQGEHNGNGGYGAGRVGAFDAVTLAGGFNAGRRQQQQQGVGMGQAVSSLAMNQKRRPLGP